MTEPERDAVARTGSALAFVVILAGLLPFLLQVLRSSMALMASTLEREFEIGATVVSMISGAFWLGVLVTVMPGGFLVARFGPRRVTLGFGVLMAAGAGWFAVGQTPAELAAARLLMGLGAGPLTPAALSAVGSRADAAQFRRLSGDVTLMARLGTLAATGPLAALLLTIGWRDTMGVLAVVVALVSVVVAALVAGGAERSPAARAPVWPPSYLGDGAVVAALVLAGAIGGIVFTLVGLWGAPWLASAYALPVAAQAVALTAMTAGFAAGAIAAPLLARAVADATVPLMVGVAVALLAVAAMDRVPRGLVTPFCAALGLALSPTALLIAYLRERLPRSVQAVAMSLVPFALAVGAVAFQSGSGLIIDAYPGRPGDHPAEAFRALLWIYAGALALAVSWFATATRASSARSGRNG